MSLFKRQPTPPKPPLTPQQAPTLTAPLLPVASKRVEMEPIPDTKVIIREVSPPKTWWPKGLDDAPYWWRLLRTLLIFLTFLIAVFIWTGVNSSTSPSPCCSLSKCTLDTDIPAVQFVAGTTNIKPVCYYGSSQIIYVPPLDPNPPYYDFGTPSLYAATIACKRAVRQSFSCWPDVVPYMANNINGTATGVYTACALVFSCTFDRHLSF